MRLAFVGLGLVFSLSTQAHAASQACTAELIKAFKTNYHDKGSGTLSQTVYNHACEDSSHNGALSYDEGAASYGDIKKACADHNMTFFQQHQEDLAVLFLPHEAFDVIKNICTAGTALELNAAEGDPITVTAWLNNGAGSNHVRTTRIRSFSYSASVECSIVNLKRGKLVENGSNGDTCTRKSDKEVLFTISTDEGYQIARLPALPVTPYLLKMYYANDYMRCSVNNVVVGNIQMGDPNNPLVTDITQFVQKGPNVVSCYVEDRHPNSAGQPDWSYKFAVFKGETALGGLQDAETGSGVRQPAPLTFIAK